MKIKVAILEKDAGYLQRIVSVFSTKYAEKIEVYSFTDANVAMATLDPARIDVLVANEAFDINLKAIPKRCGFAYFVDSPDMETFNGVMAICKFQRADLIYKQILSLYSENAANVSGLKFGDDSSCVIVFASPSGGCGCSTMAAACASHYAMQGKKTAYLNLEKYGVSDLHFSAEGQFDMSDIIYALKSKKANLAIKLESCSKVSPEGVYFFTSSRLALDTMELSAEDIIRLINEMKIAGGFDYIIVDMDFGMDKESMAVYRKAHAMIWVGDGSESSNVKIERAFQALAITEQKADMPLNNRVLLMYNKFSNKTSRPVAEVGIRSIGGAPRFEQATMAQIKDSLARLDAFDKIF